MERVALHAENFHFDREKQLEHLGSLMDRKPMLVSPYDAELFGHWWFEGPEFLYHVFKSMDSHKVIRPLTPPEYLARFNKNQVVSPSPSSWGDRGYYDVWLNGGNDWIYRHLHIMADRMEELAGHYANGTDYGKERLLNQMMRELLLAQSSDWAFLMTTRTAVEYSTRRTKEHIANFNRLYEMLNSGERDEGFLAWLEHKNSIFQHVDFREFA